ncbi:hypothetical protein TTRE_0000100201 [Trichuris trichiura]|uniref:Muscleblind-like protein n=1 Tax=Trichuris trichiura TaxID=36087 RepID=A0A077Z284_TRITR|nr:hypothetical protein TTRE_0000100201 [Trichuris trichiura]
MYDENSNNLMAMVNHLMNVKDSRWLQLEVCREFQRGQCARSENECKFAHPPSHVEVQNGRVTACYDSIKGRCTRENPKCKYLHPPQHLKDQLLINGRQNLAIKNLLMTQMSTPTISTLGVAPLTVVSVFGIPAFFCAFHSLSCCSPEPVLLFPVWQLRQPLIARMRTL